MFKTSKNVPSGNVSSQNMRERVASGRRARASCKLEHETTSMAHWFMAFLTNSRFISALTIKTRHVAVIPTPSDNLSWRKNKWLEARVLTRKPGIHVQTVPRPGACSKLRRLRTSSTLDNKDLAGFGPSGDRCKIQPEAPY